MRLAIILLSTFMVVGCPTTSMLPAFRAPTLQPPPVIGDYASMEHYVVALDEYQTYIRQQKSYFESRYGVKPKSTQERCDALSLVRRFELPAADPIISDNPAEQVNEVLDYVDKIRAAGVIHNKIIDSEVALFERLCPASR